MLPPLYVFLYIFSYVPCADLESKASGLSAVSSKYRKDATYLNMRSTAAKIAVVSVMSVVLLLYFFVL